MWFMEGQEYSPRNSNSSMATKYKLVVFDMDGTLIKNSSCWYELHVHFGTESQNAANLKDFSDGRITYDEFMRRDIALWDPLPHVSRIKEALSDFELHPNAKETVRSLKEAGIMTAIISGGVDVLAEMVAGELGIDIVIANGVEKDYRGYLTGKGICRVDINKKGAVLEHLARELGISLSNCIAVGDSKWDADMLKTAGLGIGYRPDAELAKVADRTITDLDELLGIALVQKETKG